MKHGRAPMVSLVLTLVVSGCGSAEANGPEETVAAPVSVEVMQVESVERPRTLSLTGSANANRRALLSPHVQGHVDVIHVELGQVVAEGDPLITLRASDFRLQASAAGARARAQREALGLGGRGQNFDPTGTAEVRAAAAEAERLRDQFQRTEALHESGAASDQQLQQARSALAAVEAQLDGARQRSEANLATYRALASEASLRRNNVQDTTLRAPFSGAVVSRSVEVGEFVGPSTPAIELVDASSLRVVLQVSERDAPLVSVGQQARIAIDSYDEPIVGEVRFVAAALSPATRTLTIEVVADNAEGRFRAGHFARVDLVLNESESLFSVPASAIRERAGVERVYVVRNGNATAILVQTRGQGDGVVFVEANFEMSERIITDPPQELSDGSAVHLEGA